MADVSDQKNDPNIAVRLRALFDKLMVHTEKEVADPTRDLRERAAVLSDVVNIAQQLKNLEEGHAWPTRAPDYMVKLAPDPELLAMLTDVAKRLEKLDLSAFTPASA